MSNANHEIFLINQCEVTQNVVTLVSIENK